jgi:hypothetical protein
MNAPRRCPKCCRLRAKYAHICPSPEVLRFERAMARAADQARRIYDNRGPVGSSTTPSNDFDLPTPRLVVVKPRLSTRSAPTVLLLPTFLLRETEFQREGEPTTTRYRKYSQGKKVSNFRMACKCPKGLCSPAALSTRFHHLNWSYTVVLDSPSGEFFDRIEYFKTRGLKALDALGSNPPRLTDPFHVLTIASHVPLREFDPRRPTGLHAHLAVGNVNWQELQALLSTWGYVAPNAIRRAEPMVWLALHYILSQDHKTGDPELDNDRRTLPLRHIADGGLSAGLFCPPRFSPNLDDTRFDKTSPDYVPGLVTRFRSRIVRKKRGRRS